jgi:hypothetical protein
MYNFHVTKSQNFTRWGACWITGNANNGYTTYLTNRSQKAPIKAPNTHNNMYSYCGKVKNAVLKVIHSFIYVYNLSYLVLGRGNSG